MGRLTDKIERMQKTAAPRLGFAQGSATKQPSLLLVAVLPTASRSLANAAVNAGADCLLVQQVDGAPDTSLRDKLGVVDSVLDVMGGGAFDPADIFFMRNSLRRERDGAMTSA